MAQDNINHPSYYGGHDPHECINVIEAWGVGFHLGNTLKYICRWEDKGGVEDLEKARWYLDRFIEWQYIEEARKSD